jgi:CheY-like chemotaxis protein
MNTHVLIVEDEPKIAAVLRDYFGQAGYRTDVLSRGDAVEAFVAHHQPGRVVRELQLPGKVPACLPLHPRTPQFRLWHIRDRGRFRWTVSI